jgi:ADP-ribose pyrophosphatase
MSIKPWQRVEPTVVHKIGWRTVVTKTFILPSGESVTFDTFLPEGQEFAAVIGLTPDNEVVVNRQFRVGPEIIMEELPGGFVDPGDSPDETARREFLEETGYEVGELVLLGAAPKDAYMNGSWHYYLATQCRKVAEQKLEIEEDIEVDLISIDRLIENAKHGRMTDVTGVIMAYDRLIALKEGATS